MGHRISLDFDFFTNRSFDAGELRTTTPYLSGAGARLSTPNTFAAEVAGAVLFRFRFLGGLNLRRIGVPEVTGGLRIASLLDIAATKVKVLGDRASYKDYLDIAAILEAGVALDQCAGAALTVYGASFSFGSASLA